MNFPSREDQGSIGIHNSFLSSVSGKSYQFIKSIALNSFEGNYEEGNGARVVTQTMAFQPFCRASLAMPFVRVNFAMPREFRVAS